MSYQITVSDILLELLKNNNITEYELASKIDIPRQTINKIINKKTSDPKSSTLLKIANFFDIPVDELLGTSVNQLNNPAKNIGANVESLTKLNSQKILDTTTDKPKIPFNEIDQNSRTFAVKLDDDSMFPKFAENDILVFSNELNYDKLNYVIVYINQQAKYLFRKYIVESGKSYLVPINTTYPTIILLDEDLIVGQLLKLIRQY